MDEDSETQLSEIEHSHMVLLEFKKTVGAGGELRFEAFIHLASISNLIKSLALHSRVMHYELFDCVILLLLQKSLALYQILSLTADDMRSG